MAGRLRLLALVASALAAVSHALVGLTLWGVVDAALVLASVTLRAPLALVLLSLALACAMAFLVGTAVWAALAKTPARAARVSFVVAFTLGGVVVVGTAVNRSYLPALCHPISLLADILVVAALAGVALLLARSPRRSSLVPPWGILAATLWMVLFTAAGMNQVGKRVRGDEGGRAEVEQGREPQPGQSGGAAPARNVLMIVVDSLRADAFDRSVQSGQAPSLAEIARGGVRFTAAYAQSSWTKPSVASLLTGQYPQAHGAEGRNDALPEEMNTLAEILSRAGYRTGVFSANPWVSPAFGFGQGVARFVESEPGGDPSRLLAFVRAVQAVERVGHLPVASPVARLRRELGLLSAHKTNCQRDEELVTLALAWLRSKSEAPFFAYFHLMGTHLPYEPVAGGSQVDRARQLAAQRDRSTLTSDERSRLREDYDRTVMLVDGTIKRLLEALRRSGMYDRTLILVTADHGDEIYEHSRLGHGKTLYPEVVHVPLLLSLPRVVPPGTVISEPVAGVDILPTVLSLVGIAPDAGLPGRPLRLEPRARAAASGDGIYMLLRREGGLSVASLVGNGFQYIESESLQAPGQVVRELYDLVEDPAAARNIWRPDSPVGRRLAERLGSVRAGASRRPRRGAKINDETRERLRSLGYVD